MFLYGCELNTATGDLEGRTWMSVDVDVMVPAQDPLASAAWSRSGYDNADDGDDGGDDGDEDCEDDEDDDIAKDTY